MSLCLQASREERLPQVRDWVEVIQTAYFGGRPLAFLFDYDGTLSPIVSHPSLAVLRQEVRSCLRQLATQDRVSVGVISGRPLADVRAKVGLEGLFYAGSGGAQIDLLGERLSAPVSVESRRITDTVLGVLQPLVSTFPGVWIEPKPVGFAVHYRAASASIAASFHDCFRGLLNRFPGLRYLRVCEAYEVSPADGWDKGTAVRHVLAKLAPNVMPVYVGDSENDREGMVAVRNVGGLAVGVGETAPNCCGYRLESAAEFHCDLARVCHLLTRDPG